MLDHRPVSRRCGTRLASSCSSCSALYAGDARALIRGGLVDEQTGRALDATFITLTAPGADVFGQVHSLRRTGGKRGRVRPCRCGVRHRPGEAVLGLPLDPGTYRYDLAAEFNAAAGRLAAVTWQKLARLRGDEQPLRVVRVAEYQARGLLHIHAIVIGRISHGEVRLAVSGGENPLTKRRVQPARHGRWQWGPSIKVEPVTASRGLGKYMQKLTGYAVKSAGDDRPNDDFAVRMSRAGARTCRCEHSRAACCDGSNVTDVVRNDGTAVTVAWQSAHARRPCRRHRLARRGWGFRGHVFAASRRWGVTFTQLRAKRAAWCAPPAGGSATPATVVVWTRQPRPSAPGAARGLDPVEQLVTPGRPERR